MSLYLGENLISGNKPINLGVRNIGEIVTSPLPLTDAGLHLLDGSLIPGGGIYQGFVDYIAELYNNTPISGYKSNVTKIGSLADNDGVLSNFSTSNYAQLPTSFNPLSDTWEIQLKFQTGNDVSTMQDFFSANISGQNVSCPLVFRLNNGKFVFYASSNNNVSFDIANGVTGSYTVQTNTDYVVNISFNGTNYILKYSIDGGTTFTEDINVSSTSAIYTSQFTWFGAFIWNGSMQNPVLGSIDLNGCYININNSRWWTGTEAIKPCFCTEEQWQQSVNTYGVCGKFVYDSVNNTVRLPKITGIIEGTTDATALGDLVEAGLPVHTHTRGTMEISGAVQATAGDDFMTKYTGSSWGAFNRITGWCSHSATNGGGADVIKGFNFYASRNWTGSTSNPNYTNNIQNSSTVQPQTIKCFVYIVVANSTKTEIEVDIDEIATDLNGKADVDLSNMSASQSAKDTIIGWSLPDWNNAIAVSRDAMLAGYTCPADGIICGKYNSGNTTTYFKVNNIIISGGDAEVTMIYSNVSKNDYVIAYNIDTTYWDVSFVPLKGVN